MIAIYSEGRYSMFVNIRSKLALNTRSPFLCLVLISSRSLLSLKKYSNHEEGKKVDIQRLNIEAGIDVFKGRCKITLSGYDLLSGGSEYSESFTESSYIKTWTPSYGRYCLLKLTYRFNNTNGKLIPNYSVF